MIDRTRSTCSSLRWGLANVASQWCPVPVAAHRLAPVSVSAPTTGNSDQESTGVVSRNAHDRLLHWVESELNLYADQRRYRGIYKGTGANKGLC